MNLQALSGDEVALTRAPDCNPAMARVPPRAAFAARKDPEVQVEAGHRIHQEDEAL